MSAPAPSRAAAKIASSAIPKPVLSATVRAADEVCRRRSAYAYSSHVSSTSSRISAGVSVPESFVSTVAPCAMRRRAGWWTAISSPAKVGHNSPYRGGSGNAVRAQCSVASRSQAARCAPKT